MECPIPGADCRPYCNLDVDLNFAGVCEYIDLAVKRLSL